MSWKALLETAQWCSGQTPPGLGAKLHRTRMPCMFCTASPAPAQQFGVPKMALTTEPNLVTPAVIVGPVRPAPTDTPEPQRAGAVNWARMQEPQPHLGQVPQNRSQVQPVMLPSPQASRSRLRAAVQSPHSGFTSVPSALVVSE